VHFEIVEEIEDVEVIAAGASIREQCPAAAIRTGPLEEMKGAASVKLGDGTIRNAEVTLGMKPTASARKSSRSNVSWTRRSQSRGRFALCITDSEPDLEPRKVYEVIPDEAGARSKYLRVIDESGEDYLYPEAYFVVISLPRDAAQLITTVRRRNLS